MVNITKVLRVSELSAKRAVQTHLVTAINLAYIRTGWLLFFLVTIIMKMIYEANDNPIKIILFLTNLNFYGLTGYLIVSTYISWRVVVDSEYEPWMNSHWIFRFVFWSLLAKYQITTQSTALEIYLPVATHLFNFIICICEILFGGNPVVLSHYPIILIIALLYIPYAILLHHLSGSWAYYFLNYNKYPLLFSGVILGIVISSLIFHGLLYKLHQWRDGRISAISQSKAVQSHKLVKIAIEPEN